MMGAEAIKDSAIVLMQRVGLTPREAAAAVSLCERLHRTLNDLESMEVACRGANGADRIMLVRSTALAMLLQILEDTNAVGR